MALSAGGSRNADDATDDNAVALLGGGATPAGAGGGASDRSWKELVSRSAESEECEFG